MVARRATFAVLAVALAALATVAIATAASRALGPGGPPRVELRLPPHPGPPPRVFAFMSRADGAELTHLRRYGRRIDVLAPNWYGLSGPGLALRGGPRPEVVAIAQRDGIALWPVVNARLPADGVALDQPGFRARLATAIATEAARRHDAGITLDIEQLPVALAAAYTAFVTELAARLHADHARLAVYVPRRTHTGGARAYDWRRLLGAADLLIASGYDEHWATSRPGPITSTTGFAQMLDYAAGISRQRIAPAIGAFGLSWPIAGGPARLISATAATALVAHDRIAARPRGGDTAFSVAGRVVHFQSAADLAARASDARRMGMRWLALFSLGREPDAFWRGLRTARQARARPSRRSSQPRRPPRRALGSSR